MPTDQPGLDVLIRAVLDSKGFEDLKTHLSGVTAATKDHAAATDAVTASSAQFGSAVSDLTGKLGLAVAQLGLAAGAFSFLKSVLKDAIEGEQAMTRFSAVNAEFGDVSAAAAEKNAKWLEVMERSAGVGKAELVPLYEKLISSTQNVEAAQAAMNVTLGESATTGEDLGVAVQTLTKYMQTGTVRGVGPMANEIRNLTKAGLDQGGVLQALGLHWANAADKVQTHAMQVKRAQEEWKLFKEKVGEAALGLTNYLKPALEFLAGVIARIITSVSALGHAFGSVISFAKDSWDAVMALMHGNFAEAKRLFKDAADNLAKGLDEAGNEANATQKKMMSAFTAASDTAKKTAKEIGDSLKKGLHENAVDLTALGDQIVARAIANAIAERNERIKVTKEHIQQDKLVADSIRKVYDDQAKEQIKLYQILHKNDVDYLSKYQAFLKSLLDSWKGSMHEEVAISDEAEKAKIEQLVQEKKVRDQLLASSITTLGNFFGVGKELSIAQAIINTYEGATKALAQGGIIGAALAAIVIAAGMAEVATIEATNPKTGSFTGPSGGFDDPQNDFAAYVGGQRWATDMVRKMSEGASAGFSAQMVNSQNAQTTNNYVTHEGSKNNSYYQIHLAGVMDSGDQVAMRRFVRSFQRAQQFEAQRTIR